MDKKQLNSILSQFGEAEAISHVLADSLPLREPLPPRRRTERKKVKVGSFAVYVEVGFYEDGRPGEVFLKAAKYGTMIRDVFDALAITLSVSLQHGVPLSAYPLRGKGNELTGEGNALIDAIISTVEELCSPERKPCTPATSAITSSEPSDSSTASTTPPSAAQ